MILDDSIFHDTAIQMQTFLTYFFSVGGLTIMTCTTPHNLEKFEILAKEKILANKCLSYILTTLKIFFYLADEYGNLFSQDNILS